MKKLNEATLLSTGNATSLMVFIELAYRIEKQRGMLSVAFPKVGDRGLLKMMKPFGGNEIYTEKKDQLLGIAERFYNNAPLKLLYKTLAFLTEKQTPSEEADARMQDINRVLSKIERMINGKLMGDEKELFTSLEDSIDNISDNLNSNIDSSIQGSIGTEEPEEEKPEEQPEEKPEETPKEKPKETPKEEPKTAEIPTEKSKEEPKPEEKPEEKAEEKPKTEEQFHNLIKRLVKETLRDYEKKYGKL